MSYSTFIKYYQNANYGNSTFSWHFEYSNVNYISKTPKKSSDFQRIGISFFNISLK